MTHGRSVLYGGAFYAFGNGIGSLTIKNCNSMIEYFDAVEGGFIYINNPLFKFTTS